MSHLVQRLAPACIAAVQLTNKNIQKAAIATLPLTTHAHTNKAEDLHIYSPIYDKHTLVLVYRIVCTSHFTFYINHEHTMHV